MSHVESEPAFPCPACGFLTMDEPPGSYNICRVCGWEDDHVQLANPRMVGGANRKSLVEAQAAVLERFPVEVQSAEGFERDRSWRPLREDEQLPRSEEPVLVRGDRRRDVHLLDDDGMVACNPRDPEAAHRADVGDIATTSDRAEVTCKRCRALGKR